MSAENPKNSSINPNLQSVIPPEQGGGRVSEHPTPNTGELNRIPTLPSAPETAASLALAVEEDKPWFKKTATQIGAGALVVAAGVATTVGLMLPKGESVVTTPEASGTPTASAPVTPGETVASTPEVLTVQSLEIPATLTPEQVGTTLIQDRLSAWHMAGANDETHKEWLAYNPSGKTVSEVNAEFTNQKAAGYGAIFAEALFIPDYQADAQLNAIATALEGINSSNLESYFITHSEANVYTSSRTVESTTFISQTADSLTLKINGTEHNNAAQNRIGTKYDPNEIEVNGSRSVITVTLKLIDGTYKIAQFGMSYPGQ